MNNRFRRVMWQPNTNYLPETQEEYFPDLTPVASVLDAYQGAYDASADFPLPQYLTQSESDVAGFNEYQETLQEMRQQAIDRFTEQDFSGGVSSLRGMADYLKRSQTSGGLYHELERGVSEYQAAKEEIDKIYGPDAEAYDPMIYNYMLGRLQKGIDPLRDDMGNFSRSINAPIDARYMSEDTVIERANSVLDNLTLDEVALNPNGLPQKLQGISFKYALENGYLRYMDRNKLYNVLTNAMGPDVTASYDLFGRAYGLEGQGNFQRGSIEEIEEGIATGQPFRNESRLGRLLNSLFNSKTVEQERSDKKIITDGYQLDLAKYRAKKKIDEEGEIRHYRTNAITVDPGIKKLSFSLTEDGNIQTLSEPETVITGSGYVQIGETQRDVGIKFKDYLTTDKFKEENRFAYGIAQKNMAAIESMSDDEAYRFLNKQIELSQQSLSTADGILEAYATPERMEEETLNLLAGSRTGTALGYELEHGNIAVIDGSTGKTTSFITTEEFIRDYVDGDTEQFKKGFAAHGRIRSDNALAVNGEQVTYTTPEGKQISMILTDMSEESLHRFQPIHNLYAPVANVGMESSGLVYVPELDMTIQSRPRNIYETDRISQRIEYLKRQSETITDPEEKTRFYKENIDPLIEERKQVRQSGDKVVSRTVDLFDANGNRIHNRDTDQPMTMGELTTKINNRYNQ